MEYIVGAILALGISVLATAIGLDRDRAFYPTVMIVIASYYALFAVLGGSFQALLLEGIGIAAFLLLSLIGFKITLWWVVVALTAHGCVRLVSRAFDRRSRRSLMVANVLSDL